MPVGICIDIQIVWPLETILLVNCPVTACILERNLEALSLLLLACYLNVWFYV